MTLTFDQAYGDTPVSALDQNQRDWYHPIVDRMFRQQSVFKGLVRYYQNMGAINAKNMTITEISDVHPNFDPLGLRDIWMPASHIDSRSHQITFSRYGGKVAYHEYDDIITYWKVNGAAGMRGILQGSLGQHMIDVHDYLIRNAFLTLPFQTYSGSAATAYTGFDDIQAADIFDPQIADEMWLGFSYRDVPLATNPELPNGNQGMLLCLTTPGVVYDIQQQTEDSQAASKFKNVMMYADPSRLLNYEVGMYRNTRYLASPRMTLWNSGTIETQAAIKVAISAGDGAPDPETTKVDSVYAVGQKGVTHGITVDDIGSIVVGDIVTVHVDRTSDFGVSNGVDHRDGKLHVRRVVAVSGSTILRFDRPIMEDFSTDLGGTVYGYVTKGRHVHCSIFLAGPDAVVGGVGRPPVVKSPPPVDDFEQVFRFSWNSYEGFNLSKPEVADIVFSAGSTRFIGRAAVS